MYLYNKDNRAVYDLDISVLDDLVNERLSARWQTFNDFLTWYFEATP